MSHEGTKSSLITHYSRGSALLFGFFQHHVVNQLERPVSLGGGRVRPQTGDHVAPAQWHIALLMAAEESLKVSIQHRFRSDPPGPGRSAARVA